MLTRHLGVSTSCVRQHEPQQRLGRGEGEVQGAEVELLVFGLDPARPHPPPVVLPLPLPLRVRCLHKVMRSSTWVGRPSGPRLGRRPGCGARMGEGPANGGQTAEAPPIPPGDRLRPLKGSGRPGRFGEEEETGDETETEDGGGGGFPLPHTHHHHPRAILLRPLLPAHGWTPIPFPKEKDRLQTTNEAVGSQVNGWPADRPHPGRGAPWTPRAPPRGAGTRRPWRSCGPSSACGPCPRPGPPSSPAPTAASSSSG